MGTAYIDTTIAVEHNGVFLFETECVAQVEYEIDGTDLYDFSITDFRFDKTEGRWDGEVFRRVTVAEAWCPADLREILYRFVDYNFVQEKLLERLTETGELKAPGSTELRADHHAAVL
jgi:hypothetical protein